VNTLAACDWYGNLHYLNVRGDVEIALGSKSDSGVSTLHDRAWDGEPLSKPSGLHLETNYDEEVGTLQFQQPTGASRDEMRVLVTEGKGRHLDSIASNLANQGGQIGG
jgi:hypothetical protein